MRKKILSLLIALCLLVTIFPINLQEASAATTPKKIYSSDVNNRIKELQTLNGNYFTKNNKPCVKESGHGCSNCNVTNVLANNSTIRNLIYKHKGSKNVSSYSNLPIHYYGSYKFTLGSSCVGFANFAEWYIFSNKTSDKVNTKAIKTSIYYNYTNMKKYVKPGDVLRLSKGHSAIVISVGKSGVKVINCNLNSSGAKISTEILYYNAWNCNVGISRASNYVTSSTTSWQSSLKAKNYASSGKTVLSWNSYSGASKYYVYRRKASSKRYTKIATTKSKTYVDKTATNGTYYYYYVKAVSKSGKTLKISSKISRTCDLARPLLKSITCIPSSGAIKISFKGVKNANRYKIYRATSKNGKYSCIYTIKRKKTDKGGESLSFTNKSTTPGKTYYYKIRAVTSKNIGADSATKYCYRTRDLARPVVKAKTRSDGKIVLSWGKIKYADKYYVYRAVKGGKYSKIATVTSTSYTNSTSLKNGTTYYYKVKAIDSNKSAANSATSVAVSKKYENKVIGFVSESTYKSKYKNSKKYSAKPYYRYKTRSVQTTTSTSSSLSGWTLISKSTNYKYGSWTTTKPSSNYESKSVYYYYAYVCNCRKMYWKSSNSDTCSNCNTKMTNILKVYSSNNPSLYYKKDTDGSYFTPKTLDKSNPGKLGTIYYMTYNGNSISKFISTSSKNTSFLWPSSSLRTIVYRTKTPTTIYKYQKYGSWSNWSNWTSTYKANSTTQKRDTTTKYYILKK